MPDRQTRELAAHYNEQDCEARLLRLPPELRNRIYDLVTPPQKEYENGRVWLNEKIENELTGQPFREPPILQVCRQIRHEMLKMCLEHHIYSFDDTNQRTRQNAQMKLQTWLNRLQLVVGRYVRDLRIQATIQINLGDVYLSGKGGKVPKAKGVMLV